MTLGGLLLAFVISADDISARQATNELLSVLPKQCAVVVIAEDLHGVTTRWDSLPLGRRLNKVGFSELSGWNEIVEAKRRELDGELKRELGLDLQELNREVFGLSTVLAYWPGSSPESDAGLMLVRARSQERLSTAIENLFASQGRKPQRKTYNGVEYWSPGEQGKAFVAVYKSIGIATQQEFALKAVIDADKNKAGWLTDPVVAVMRETTPTAVGQMYVLPRKMDHRLPRPQAKDAGEAALAGILVQAWSSAEWAAATIQLENEPICTLSVSFDGNKAEEVKFKTPSNVQATNVAGPPTVGMQGLLALMTIRLDTPTLTRWSLESAIRHRDKNADEFADVVRNVLWGVDPIRDLIPAIGPRLSIAVSKGVKLLPDLTIAIELTETPFAKEKAKPTNAELIDGVVQFSMLALALESNKEGKDTWRTGVEVHKSATLRYLHGSQKTPQFEPCVAVHDGWVYFGSTRDAVRKVLDAPSKPQTDIAALVDIRSSFDYVNDAPEAEFVRSLAGWDLARKFATEFPRVLLRTSTHGNVHRLRFEIPEAK